MDIRLSIHLTDLYSITTVQLFQGGRTGHRTLARDRRIPNELKAFGRKVRVCLLRRTAFCDWLAALWPFVGRHYQGAIRSRDTTS